MQYTFRLISSNCGPLSAISIDSDFQNGLQFLVRLHYQASSGADHLFRGDGPQLMAPVVAERHRGTTCNVLFWLCI